MKSNLSKYVFSFMHDSYGQGSKIMINVENIKNEDDEVRNIKHPDWNKFWNNECENVFSSKVFKTDTEANIWLTSIGMTHNQEDDN